MLGNILISNCSRLLFLSLEQLDPCVSGNLAFGTGLWKSVKNSKCFNPFLMQFFYNMWPSGKLSEYCNLPKVMPRKPLHHSLPPSVQPKSVMPRDNNLTFCGQKRGCGGKGACIRVPRYMSPLVCAFAQVKHTSSIHLQQPKTGTVLDSKPVTYRRSSRSYETRNSWAAIFSFVSFWTLRKRRKKKKQRQS